MNTDTWLGKTKGTVTIAAVSLLLTSAGAAEFPVRETRYINDYSQLLDADTESRIRTQLAALNSRNGIEVTVLTIRSFKDFSDPNQSFGSYATQLFNHWAIGNSATNKGVLLLIGKDDRKVRIELGKGYSRAYDRKAKHIIDTTIVPEFKQGRFSRGILNGVVAIEKTVTAPVPSPRQSPPLKKANRPITVERENVVYTPAPTGGISLVSGALGTGLLGVIAVFFMRFRKPKCRRCHTKMEKSQNAEKRHELMTDGQRTEARLHSASFTLFCCHRCQEFQLKRSGAWFSPYSGCTKCGNKAMTSDTRTLIHATETRRGSEQIDENCLHCSYQNTYTRSTARLSSSSSGSAFGSSCSSGGGGISSGGGGSSSGGGASGSW